MTIFIWTIKFFITHDLFIFIILVLLWASQGWFRALLWRWWLFYFQLLRNYLFKIIDFFFKLFFFLCVCIDHSHHTVMLTSYLICQELLMFSAPFNILLYALLDRCEAAWLWYWLVIELSDWVFRLIEKFWLQWRRSLALREVCLRAIRSERWRNRKLRWCSQSRSIIICLKWIFLKLILQ